MVFFADGAHHKKPHSPTHPINDTAIYHGSWVVE